MILLMIVLAVLAAAMKKTLLREMVLNPSSIEADFIPSKSMMGLQNL